MFVPYSILFSIRSHTPEGGNLRFLRQVSVNQALVSVAGGNARVSKLVGWLSPRNLSKNPILTRSCKKTFDA